MNRKKALAFLQISRANLLLTSIGHATIGLFLGAGSFDVLMSSESLLFIALHFSIAFFACNINCLYDYDVDSRYKKYMSQSLKIYGIKNLKNTISMEALVIGSLITYFILSGFIITGVLAIIGAFFAYAYSAEPIRIKKRGSISPIPIMFGLYLLPIIGGWFVFQSSLTFGFVIFCFGYMFMNQGYTLINTAEDYTEDKQEGIITLAHILGLKRILQFALVLSILGLMCPMGLIMGFVPSNAGLSYWLFWFAVTISSLLIIIAANEVRMVGQAVDLEASAKTYAVRLQRWFMMGRYPLILVAIILML